jgi:hypothetical protein
VDAVWELGYFDGFRPNHVAILPLVKAAGSGFAGQEYLGLYPYVEDISFLNGDGALGVFSTAARDRASTIEALVEPGFR